MIKMNDDKYFEYVAVGEFRTGNDWIHGERIMDSHELIVVLDGLVYIEEDGKKYTLAENEMLILESGKQHRGFRVSSPPTAFYWFHFRTDIQTPFKTYRGNNYYEIKFLIKKLLHIANTPAYTATAADAAALMIFEELCTLVDAKSESSTAIAYRMAEYIRINADSDITASVLAQHFGYNADYLGKIFKKSFNLGVKEYICNQKITGAKNLLLMSDMSVKQIASCIGYDDENLFVKFFKYHEGISPTVFRNRYKGTYMNNK